MAKKLCQFPFLQVPPLLTLALLPSLLLAISSSDFEHHGRPILLTNVSLPSEKSPEKGLTGGWRWDLPFMIFDQCMPHPDSGTIGSYGLQLQLPHGFGCPAQRPDEHGLLVCYLGQMDIRTLHGVRGDGMYSINNLINNTVHEACQARRRVFCQANPEQCKPGGVGFVLWHGIQLFTEVINGVLELVLLMSTNRLTYKVPVWEDLPILWLKLGDADSLDSVLGYQEYGIWKNLYDDPRREYFHKNVHRGAKLHNFNGIWSLGLDMLPHESQHELQLFVFRDCKCTIQAWFTQPTDTGMPIIPTIDAGSGSCKKNNFVYNETTQLAKFGEGEKMAQFRVLSYNEETSANITLLDKDNKTVIYVKAMQTPNDDGSRMGTLEFGGPNGKWDYETKSINLTAEETKRMEGKTQLFVQIKNYGYFYVFTVGDPRQPVVKNTFWPDQWKQGKGIGNGNASLHVEASRMVGGIVEVTDSEPLDSIMIPPHSFKLPKAVASGSVITFRAKVDENTNGFKIRLLHDAPECHFYLGATVMLIEVDFNNEIVKWMSYDNQKEHNQGSQTNSLFEAGKVFECKMVITQQDDQQKKIQIAVFVDDELLLNFTGNLPIWTLNWMQTEGGIKLFDQPIFDIAEETSKLFKLELDHLLYHGDVLCIDGKFKAVGDEPFNIYLFHEANEWSYEIGDVALQIKYSSESDKFYFDTFLHDTNSTTGVSKTYAYKMLLGQTFNFKIEVENNKYYISFMGADEKQEFEDKVNKIPPWAANWLTVEGAENVTFGVDSDSCTASKNPLPSNMLQLYPYNLLESGDEIVVKGKVGDDELVEVWLFREALAWHRIIGQTVLRVQFKAPFDNFTFNSYIGNWTFLQEGNTTNTRAIDVKLVKEQEFKLRIVAISKNWFKIVYEDENGKQYVLQYEKSAMPIWAVHYVVVNGLQLPANDGHPAVIVERKKAN